MAAHPVVQNKVQGLMAASRIPPIDVPSVLLPKLLRALAADAGAETDGEVFKSLSLGFVPMIGSYHLSTLRTLGQQLSMPKVQLENKAIVNLALRLADFGIQRSKVAMNVVAQIPASNVQAIAAAVADAIDPPKATQDQLSNLGHRCSIELNEAALLCSSSAITVDDWRSRVTRSLNRYVEAEIDWLINRPYSDHWLDVHGFGTGGRFAFEESSKNLAMLCAGYIRAPMLEGLSLPAYLHSEYWKLSHLSSELSAEERLDIEVVGEVRAQLHETLAMLAILRPVLEDRQRDDMLMWETGALGLMHCARADNERKSSRVSDRLPGNGGTVPGREGEPDLSKWVSSLSSSVLPITREALSTESSIDDWDRSMRCAQIPLHLISVATDSESHVTPNLAKSFYSQAAQFVSHSSRFEDIWSRAAAGHVEDAFTRVYKRYKSLCVAHEKAVLSLYSVVAPGTFESEHEYQSVMRTT